MKKTENNDTTWEKNHLKVFINSLQKYVLQICIPTVIMQLLFLYTKTYNFYFYE